MRSFIRHPSNMPIEFESKSSDKITKQLQNVSIGGLCFKSDLKIKKGTTLNLTIPNLKQRFEEKCIVIWCRKIKKGYMVGVKFLDDQTTFRMRMVEQICYIENYREEIRMKEGRALTSKEASAEWIAKFADKFPKV